MTDEHETPPSGGPESEVIPEWRRRIARAAGIPEDAPWGQFIERMKELRAHDDALRATLGIGPDADALEAVQRVMPAWTE